MYIYIYIYIYIHMYIFTTEGLFEIAIDSWRQPRRQNSVQML